MPRVFLLDNYDSFTYNLYQALAVLGAEVTVARNDRITPDEALALQPSHVVLSPGPGRPENAGVMMEVLAAFSGRVPVLGVCLGHQAIGLHFGGKVVHAPHLMHGKSSEVIHDGTGLFAGLPSPLSVARYHSLIVEDLPTDLVATSRTAAGELMSVAHARWPVVGVQFHPESVLTPRGDVLLANFLAL